MSFDIIPKSQENIRGFYVNTVNETFVINLHFVASTIICVWSFFSFFTLLYTFKILMMKAKHINHPIGINTGITRQCVW